MRGCFPLLAASLLCFISTEVCMWLSELFRWVVFIINIILTVLLHHRLEITSLSEVVIHVRTELCLQRRARMACLTIFVLLVDLIFLAGILSPWWVRIIEEGDPLSPPDTNSTNYGLFFYSKCSKEGCLTNMIYGESYNHTYQGLLFLTVL